MRAILSFLTMMAALCLAPATALAQDPVPIGNETCKTCHVPYEAHKVNIYHGDCLACHTPETRHLSEGGKGTVKFPAADKCLSCHQSNDARRMNWAFSEHKRARLDCRECHGIHAPKVKELEVGMWKSDKHSALCMSCHKDVASRMNMPSHHPVKEGGLACTSCHDPHDSKQARLVSKNDQCYTCHQAIRGPKVFEHAPVVEDCTICHNPHGTPNRRLLNFSQPMQCLQCHSMALTSHPLVNGKQSGVALRNCTSCHGAIHGSHIDPKLKH